MKTTIELMIKIFNNNKVDWMNDEIKSISDLTCHHIVKREDGGASDISNYALLTVSSHRLLHYLEDNYYNVYVYLNNKFLEINRSLKEPTYEYYEEIKSILKRVKKDIKNKKRFGLLER